MRLFRNDYSEGAAPRILDALARTNDEQTVGYSEGDPYCERARELVRGLCDAPGAHVEFCAGGTSANTICVSGLLKDYEGVICTPDAHINTHETGSVGATGRTILATRDTDGFLSVAEAERVYRFQTSCGRHMVKPGAIYITNTTEFGGVWERRRFDEVCAWARSRGLKIYLDGARLANALVAPDNELTLPHIAHSVDAFTIGGTKNGMLFGEAVVVMDETLAEDIPYLIKERGGLMAKGRLYGVQFTAALEDGYWLRLAANANRQALAIRDGLVALGWETYLPSTSNQQFFRVPDALGARMEEACGCETFLQFDDGTRVIRFVCSWATRDEDVAELLAFCKGLA